MKFSEAEQCLEQDVSANFLSEVLVPILDVICKRSIVHKFQKNPYFLIKVIDLFALYNGVTILTAHFHDSYFVNDRLEFLLLACFHIFKGQMLPSLFVLREVYSSESSAANFFKHFKLNFRVILENHDLFLEFLGKLFVRRQSVHLHDDILVYVSFTLNQTKCCVNNIIR